MSDNPGAPFAVPQDVYDNLDSKAGVEPFEPIDPAQYYELRDLAFAEYLAYNTTLASDNENRLPANIVIVNG